MGSTVVLFGKVIDAETREEIPPGQVVVESEQGTMRHYCATGATVAAQTDDGDSAGSGGRGGWIRKRGRGPLLFCCSWLIEVVGGLSTD